MANYKPYNYNQSSMVIINFEDQIQPGTFEHAIHFLISERLDLSIFEPKYKNDTGGRPAFDPAILLKSFCSHIPKASPPAARLNGAARIMSSSKPSPATPSLTSPPLPVLLVATQKL